MKSCVIQRDVIYVSTAAVVLMMLYGSTGSAYGQVTDSAFDNCVMMSGGYTVDVIMLGTDEDCDDEQFAQAVNHYKAQGYTERQYSSMLGEKIMSLQK